MEADVASGVENTEILMASYDNTSQGKSWIFDSGSTVYVCSQKDLFNNSLVAKEEGIVKMVDGLACKVMTLGQSRLQVEMGQCVLWRRSGIS